MVTRAHGPGFVVALSAALALTACRPSLAGKPSLVDGPRVLAVKSLPAEAGPNAQVSYEVLYVDVDGPADASKIDWALCSARKPIAAPGSVAQACYARSSSVLTALGAGATVKGTLAKDVCQVFGPTPPVPMPGEPNGRPADPDTTGGYYQPVRLLTEVSGEPDTYDVGTTRLVCGLGGATIDQLGEYNDSYRPNENPLLQRLVLTPRESGGKDVTLSDASAAGASVVVKAGAQVTLHAHWASCPVKSKCGDGICGAHEDVTKCSADCTTPKGCTGAEPYVFFDPVTRAITPRRESIRISWFATDGEFEHDRTGRSESDAELSTSDNTWTAPTVAGAVSLWVVIRDDRGGVGWHSYKLDVQR
jgi:hypothetical protein